MSGINLIANWFLAMWPPNKVFKTPCTPRLPTALLRDQPLRGEHCLTERQITNEMTRPYAIKNLMTLPNIGKTMAEYLYELGIESVEEFKASSPEQVWEQLKRLDTKATICRTHLKVLVAAHRGVPMNQVDDV